MTFSLGTLVTMRALNTRTTSLSLTTNEGKSPSKRRNITAPLIAVSSAVLLAGCATTEQTAEVFRIDRAQGSSENISSLTAVINSNPQDPEGYNVRGSAYGRSGESKRAIEDFNRALQL